MKAAENCFIQISVQDIKEKWKEPYDVLPTSGAANDQLSILLTVMSVCNKAQIESIGSGSLAQWSQLSQRFLDPVKIKPTEEYFIILLIFTNDFKLCLWKNIVNYNYNFIIYLFYDLLSYFFDFLID